MSFLDLIVEENNHFLLTIKKMQNNGYPLVLIGAGCLAQMTWDFLKGQQVKIDYVAINQAWLSAGDNFNGWELTALEQLASEGKPVNYIYAIQYVPEELTTLLANTSAESLIFDPSFIGVNTTEIITLAFCQQHEAAFEALYQSLGDERSKQTLIAFINQRICAQTKYYKNVFEPVHYFPADIINLKDNEVFVDCGAYNGDSIAAFHSALLSQGAGLPKKIFAFEPDSANFAALQQNTQDTGYCVCLQEGVWSSESTLRFSSGKALSSKVSEDEGDEIIHLTTIDKVVVNEKVTFIKMDVEGAELDALKGAKKTIATQKPTLAISAYHKPDDLLALSLFIKEIEADYRFYLRAHHPLHAFELVLYALPC
ncbi:FkbM family methyltransferase [Pantoea agglomerans]|uniref:FkbM family methyltransferase n=2 Tax=Enterobacter agglomerans TaxID=549 RepID=A0ACC5RQJ6_ENTAG|nr:FkbM family methyltransferase [Pantoea agglomerans]